MMVVTDFELFSGIPAYVLDSCHFHVFLIIFVLIITVHKFILIESANIPAFLQSALCLVSSQNLFYDLIKHGAVWLTTKFVISYNHHSSNFFLQTTVDFKYFDQTVSDAVLDEQLLRCKITK